MISNTVKSKIAKSLSAVLIASMSLSLFTACQKAPSTTDSESGYEDTLKDESNTKKENETQQESNATGEEITQSESKSEKVLLLAAAPKAETVLYPNDEDLWSGKISQEEYNILSNTYYDHRRERFSFFSLCGNGADSFSKKLMNSFLSESTDKNIVFSPLNIYLAFAALSEVTDNESRNQILSALGEESIDSLREHVNALWQSNSVDDGVLTSLLASSVWLRNDTSYNQETLNNLANYFYTSSYSGDMADKAYSKELQNWLNENTKNLLADQAGKIEFSPETVMGLATTIYFKGSWMNEFNEYLTKKDTFHAKSGDTECDFMFESKRGTLYYGDNFTAIKKSFNNGATMLLMLPGGGVDVSELVNDSQVEDFIFGNEVETRTAMINLKIPKFDIDADFDLIETIEALGMTDILDAGKADFTPLTTMIDKLALSSATHAARVKIDEQGCEAAAFTVLMVNATSMPVQLEEYDFTLDKPFMFVIQSQSGQVLFVGEINKP